VNESFKFTSWSDVFDLRPGEQVVETRLSLPSDFRLSWFEVYKEEEGHFFLGSVEDSWGADNWAEATIRVFNTSSVIFWVFLFLAAIVVLLVLALFVSALRSALSAQTLASGSEWVEGCGRERGLPAPPAPTPLGG